MMYVMLTMTQSVGFGFRLNQPSCNNKEKGTDMKREYNVLQVQCFVRDTTVDGRQTPRDFLLYAYISGSFIFNLF